MDKPLNSFEFIETWFEQASNVAKKQGRKDSAALWEDGLKQLRYYKSLNDDLLAACKEAVRCLTEDVELTNFVNQMKAAIAKAEG